jgi:hypothetical protein
MIILASLTCNYLPQTPLDVAEYMDASIQDFLDDQKLVN